MELQEKLCSWLNLQLAYQSASRGKRGRGATAQYEMLLGDNLLNLQASLESHSYRPGGYRSFYVHEPKRRLISAAPFPDRVAHHALCNVTNYYFEQRFISASYANRLGKGTHRALEHCQNLARRHRYFLQCDVVQFFPSIDHQILLEELKKSLPDESVFWLVERILESGRSVLAEEYRMVYFPNDDLFAFNRPRGLPIGNLTSQWWANCYLNPFDHFVMRELSCTAYLRYVDDFILFADDKNTLWQWRSAILKRMARLRLTLHEEQAIPRPVIDGVRFLGFVTFPEYRLLKNEKGIAFQRRLKKLLRAAAPEKVKAALQGWVNHVRYGNTYGLVKSVLAKTNLLGETYG